MKCSFIKPDGSQCNANPISDSRFCFFHDPNSDEKKKEAQISGGKANKVILKEALPILIINESKDIISLLIDTINRVRSGEIDIRLANCLGVLSGQLIKAFEMCQISDRVEIVEQKILEKKTTYNN
ncbi:MAG TPA: hypothetical protein VIK86_08825 [Candidatus Paceibacterota bacterium]